jgi:exonuclease SbcC
VILQTLRVESFAGLSACSVEFAPGLNVVLGPNEAGKSTLLAAIEQLLLTPVSLPRRELQGFGRRFFPLGGGDTVRASLGFLVEGRSYALSKSWGARPAAELELPDGSRLAEEARVQEALRGLLPAGPGTLRTVFLTQQSGLAATVERLEEESETLHSFTDVLRRSLLEMGEFSVSRFQARLQERLQEHLAHWDLARERPEGNRGLGNRWKKGVGRVLEAHYRVLETRTSLEQAAAREEEYGQLGEQLQQCRQGLAEAEARLQGWEKAARGSRERAGLEPELRSRQQALAAAQESLKRWTEVALRLESLDRELPELERRLLELQQERGRAEAQERDRQRRARMERLREKRGRWQEAERALAKLPPLPAGQLQKMEQARAELQRLEAALGAGNLLLRMQANKELELTATTDGAEPEPRRVPPGEALQLRAGGRILLEHRDWSLEVSSGVGNAAELAGQHAEARRRLQELLEASQVEGMEQARERCHRYEGSLAEARTAQAVYEEELGGESYEALESEEAAREERQPVRPLGAVTEELGRTESRLQQAGKERLEQQRQLQGLEQEYGQKERLLTRIGELSGTAQELQRRLQELAPLPKGFSEPDTFLRHYEEQMARAGRLREEQASLRSALLAAEKALPEESSEELGRRMEEEQGQYVQELQKARSLLRVQQATAELLEQRDSGLLEPFGKLLGSYLQGLTGGRYREVHLQGALPDGVQRPDGRLLPRELLSAGTRDIFALALRLAMAEMFLSGREGFLLMDDPLVELDPERQERAVQLLSRYGGERQLVLFTCHPTHAARFTSAKAVELPGP